MRVSHLGCFELEDTIQLNKQEIKKLMAVMPKLWYDSSDMWQYQSLIRRYQDGEYIEHGKPFDTLYYHGYPYRVDKLYGDKKRGLAISIWRQSERKMLDDTLCVTKLPIIELLVQAEMLLMFAKLYGDPYEFTSFAACAGWDVVQKDASSHDEFIFINVIWGLTFSVQI